MKRLYFFSAFVLFAFLNKSLAQVEVYDGASSTQNVAGTVLNVVLWGQEQEGYIYFKNVSTKTITYNVTREQITPINFSIVEQLCVGAANGFGNCYQVNTSLKTYDFPTPVTLAVGEKGLIEYIFGDYDIPANVHNRYYIKNETDGSLIDSIDVQAQASLSTKQLDKKNSTFNISAFPNPANDYLMVSVNGSNMSTVKIVDVLGKTVLLTTVNGNKKLDVSRLNDGVYILTVSSDHGNTMSKRVVIRH